MKNKFKVQLFAFALCVIAPWSAGAADLRAHFGVRTVFVDGLTSGGEVVIYSIARSQTTFQSAHSDIWKVLRTAGSNGSIQADMPGEIEPHRLWIIVDQNSGRYLITRTAADAAVKRYPHGLIRHGQDGRGGKLSFSLPVATVFLIRAGEAVWISTLGDGGLDDDDGVANAETVLRVEKLNDFRRRGKTAEKYKKDDAVIVLDPVSLRVYEERLK